MKIQQVWKDIKGYQNLYQVSNLGRIKSLKFNHSNNEKIIKGIKIPIKQKKRIYYCCKVRLYKNNKWNDYLISRLVWKTFNGEIQNNYQIDHIDNNPENNSLDNLQLLTCSENNKKKYIDNPNLSKSFVYNLEKINPKKKVKCLETKQIFQSLMQASRKMNIRVQSISKVINGYRKSIHGLHFALID